MFKLGNYVQDKVQGYKGRVYAKYHNFKDTNTSSNWLAVQSCKVSEEDLKNPWYSILCKKGGSVLIPESRLVKIEKMELNNPWESYYFEEN